MTRSRIFGLAFAAILSGSLGAVTACGTSDDAKETMSLEQVKAASVTLELLDDSGNQVGTGSGVLIAPRTVLTSGHLVAGFSKWRVKGADGKTTANGTRGMTYDWMDYDSKKSHPRKHDVGIVYLDRSIQLSAYPKLAKAKVKAGDKGERLRKAAQSFESNSATFSRVNSFPHAFMAEMPSSEKLDTGGAVLNEKNEIIGIVTGKGLSTQ